MLWQCSFLENKCTQILKGKGLLEKLFVMNKGTEKSWIRLFLVISQQKVLLILHTHPTYFVLILRTAGRDNILVEGMLTSTYKSVFKTEQNYQNHYFFMLICFLIILLSFKVKSNIRVKLCCYCAFSLIFFENNQQDFNLTAKQ